MSVYKLLFRLADTVGDGSGTKQALGNYAGSPTVFKLTAQPGEHIAVHRMIMEMVATSFANSDQYGTGAALTNGISMYVTDMLGVIQYYLTDEDHPIKANAEWGHQCFDYQHFDTQFGAGAEYAAARWTFSKSGQPVELLPGWSINVLLEDDLREVTSGLTEHGFFMNGYFLQPTIGDDDGHS